jgi:hypothetical protein
VVLQREEPLRLPPQQLIGQALERLAQHDEAAGVRVTSAQVQVGQPAAAPSVPPFDGEHHQVQGVPRLDLDPAGAPAARRVGRIQRLDHHAFVSMGDRVTEELRGCGDRAGDQAGREQLGRHGPGQLGVPPPVGQVDQVRPLQVQHVEQEHRQRDGRGSGVRVLAGGARRGVLERQRPAVAAQRDQLAVEDRRANRQLRQRRHHVGEPAGDLIERPGEQPDAALGQVSLDPDPVKLPLHRPLHRIPALRRLRTLRRWCPRVAADLSQRLGDVRRAGGKHRPHRAADLEPESLQRLTTARERGRGDRPERAAQHHGPAHVRDGHPGRAGDRLGHHSFQRALPELAGKQAVKKLLLGLGGPAKQLADQRLPRGRRARARDRADGGKAGVHLAKGQGRDGRRRETAPQRGPADADLPLRQFAGQVRDGNRHLERPGLAQRRRERLDLGEPGAGRSHGPRHFGDLSKQHAFILPSAAGPRPPTHRRPPPQASPPLS